MFLAPPEKDDWLMALKILAQREFEESVRQAIQKAAEKSLNSHFLKRDSREEIFRGGKML